MGFILKPTVDRSECDRMAIPYGPEGGPVPKGGKAAGELVFYLRPRWRGQDVCRINDSMWATGPGGQAVPQFGAGAREKVVCGVVAIDGLTSPDGREVQDMSREVYNALPSWVVDQILARLNTLNADQETLEGE